MSAKRYMILAISLSFVNLAALIGAPLWFVLMPFWGIPVAYAITAAVIVWVHRK